MVQTQETQLALARKEFAGVGSLADRGLATSSRSLGLQRDVAQLDGDRLKVMNSQNQAQEELSKAELSIIALRNTRVKDITLDLSQTQTKINEYVQRHKMNEQLLVKSTVGISQLRSERGDPEMQATYTIVRTSSDHPEELPAAEDTMVKPGDTVKVVVPLPPINDVGEYGLTLEVTAPPSPNLAKALDSAIGPLQQ